MELTFKQIAALRRILLPRVYNLQSQRLEAKEEASECWYIASPANTTGKHYFGMMNVWRDQYRKATAELREIEGVLTELKLAEKKMQKLRAIEIREDELIDAMNQLAIRREMIESGVI
jgi:hypothetical protein